MKYYSSDISELTLIQVKFLKRGSYTNCMFLGDDATYPLDWRLHKLERK